MPTQRLLLLLLPIALACSKPDSATPPFARGLAVDLSASTQTPTGLYYRDLVVGTGPEVATGQLAAVRYTGWLPDGTRFDGNESAGPPYTFQVGAGRVIPGWDQGVAGMHVGGKRQLIIPPDLGYGAAGNGPIPPNSTLVFVVEVVAAQ